MCNVLNRINTYNVDVDVGVLHAAFVNWVEYHGYAGLAGMRDATQTLNEFLGEPKLPMTGSLHLTDEQIRRVKLLAGPHSYTVIKAYHAKKSFG